MALKASCFNDLISSKDDAQRATATNREQELESFVKEAKDFVRATVGAPASSQGTTEEVPIPPPEQFIVPTKLFMDFSYPYSDRLANLKYFYTLSPKEVVVEIHRGLSKIFDLLYTKNKIWVKHGESACFRWFSTWMLTLLLAIPSIVLLHCSHKQAYSHNDVIVTFVMVYGTLLVDIISVQIIGWYNTFWVHVMAQQSLIGFFTRNKRHKMLISIADCLQCKGLLD